MEHFHYKIPGWFTFPRLYSQMVKTYDAGHFVEVGAWQGSSAAFMAVEIINSKKNIKFDVIDIWGKFSIAGLNTKNPELLPEDTVEKLFYKNIEPVKHVVNASKIDSISGSRIYKDKSLDFVFIDANHSYDSVINDLNAWFPKVKSGGHIAGHDYATDRDVRVAVQNFFKTNTDTYDYGENCWCAYKL